MTKTINIATVGYALLCIGLGIAAYISKHHIMSLVGGVGIGLVELYALNLWKSGKQRVGRIVSLVAAVITFLMFIPRFLGGAIYPNGVMVIASLIFIGLLLAGHMQAMKAKQETPAA